VSWAASIHPGFEPLFHRDIVRVDDVFRAAWVQSVAALDHWVRQEVRYRMLRQQDQGGVFAG
jgi:hypothetical protein